MAAKSAAGARGRAAAVRVVASLERREPALRVASGAACLAERLGEPVVLEPVTAPEDLLRALNEGGAALAVTDALGWPAPERGWKRRLPLLRSVSEHAPVCVVCREDVDAASMLGSLGIDVLSLPSLRHAAAAGLGLLRRLYGPDLLRFLQALPPGLEPDHVLAVAWAALHAGDRPTAEDLAARCGRELERLEYDLRRAGMPAAGAMIESARLWSVFHAVQTGRCGSLPEALRAYGFVGTDAFEEACLRLTGSPPVYWLGEGDPRGFLRCLARRWRGQRLPTDVPVPRRRLDPSLQEPEDEWWTKDRYEQLRGAVERGVTDGGGRPEWVDDATHDVCKGILERQHDSRGPPRHPRVFSRKSGRNWAIDAARRNDEGHRDLASTPEGAFHLDLPDRDSRDEPVDPPPALHDLRARADRLPEPPRLVVRLRCDGWSHGEIGRLLGKGDDAVRQIGSRARRALKGVAGDGG